MAGCAGAHGTVSVLHRIGQLHFFAIVQEPRRIANDFGVKRIRNCIAITITVVLDLMRAIHRDQQWVKVQIIQVF